MKKMTAFERFINHVEKQGDCIVWTGGLSSDGYGLVYDPELARTRRAHRVAYEQARGPIPSGHFVCHTCDNPRCVNPAHLFAGTPRENTQDMLTKGRRKNSRRGASHHANKLSLEDRNEIRAMVERGEKQSHIARHYGVSQALVSQICRRVFNYSPEKEAILAEAQRLWSESNE